MNNNRIWIISGALVIVIVLTLSGLLGVKPQLDAAAASDSDRAAVELLNGQHAAELIQLRTQAETIDELRSQVAELRRSVPASDDLDTFIGELGALQAVNGVVVTNYTPAEAVLFLPAPAVEGAIPASVMNNNFASISVAITVTGARESTLNFVKGLQTGSRLVLVSDVSVAPAADGVTTTTITGLVYVLLDVPYVDPAAAPAPAPEAAAAE
ncbi:Tfp pilus assembly protein PilO [Conyzicola nivalis]|uniref:Tfp pilus assembly protein PilO n=1 Tax=Conyzicola nivalis TaxID=1477021 RepID=A0ABV2QP29_9MICO